MKRLLRLRPSPAMVVALIALFVAMGGVSYGLATGSVNSREIKNNTVRSKDIRNNNVTTRDLRNNSARGRDVRNNSLTGRDINESTLEGLIAPPAPGQPAAPAQVPSGATVTGSFGDIASPPGTAGASTPFQRQVIGFALQAPANLTDAQVNAAPGAAGGDDDATCTGSANNPTAPAGKVCLYSSSQYSGAVNGTLTGFAVPGTNSRHGFQVRSTGTAGSFGGFIGTWAYTAP
jgi:hypothetical protein